MAIRAVGFGVVVVMHCTYIGPRKELSGDTALVQIVKGKYHAQFDDLEKHGEDSEERLAFGWHPFEGTDFKITEELE